MSEEPAVQCDGVLTQIALISESAIDALVQAAKQPSSVNSAWPIDERYWFSGTANVRFTKAEDAAIRRCWTGILVALSVQYADQDIRRRKPGKLMAWFDRVAEPRGYIRLEGEAGGVLQRVFGGDIWLAVTVVWNACCAGMLGERLPDDLRASLERGWRMAEIGPTPSEGMTAGRR